MMCIGFTLFFSQFLSLFGQSILAKTDFICVGKIQQTLQKQVEVAHLQIESFIWVREKFTAPSENEVITILGNALGLHAGESYILFLSRLQTQRTFKVIGKISKETDESCSEKLQNIQELLSIEQLESLEEKQARLKAFFLKNLQDTDFWLKTNAYGELGSLASRFPKIFEQRDVDQIIRAYFRTQATEELEFKGELKKLLVFLKSKNRELDITLSLSKIRSQEEKKVDFSQLSPKQKEAWLKNRLQFLKNVVCTPQTEEDARKAWQELYSLPISFLEPFLVDLLTETNSELLIKTTDWLVKRGTEKATTPLLQFAQSASGKAKANALKALGRLKVEESLPLLQKHLHPNDPECDTYLTALALFDSEHTQNLLRDFRDQQMNQVQAEDWAQKINYLLSKNFRDSQALHETQRIALEQNLLNKWFPTPPTENSSPDK